MGFGDPGNGGAESFVLDRLRVAEVPASTVDARTVSVGAGGSVYYKASSDVSSSSYDGVIPAGSSRTFTSRVFITSASSSSVVVSDVEPDDPVEQPRSFGCIEVFGASIAAGYNAAGGQEFFSLLADRFNAQGTYVYAYPDTRSYKQAGPLGRVMETLRRSGVAPWGPPAGLGVFTGIYGDIEYTPTSTAPSVNAYRSMIQTFRSAKTYEENNGNVAHSTGSRTSLGGSGGMGAGSSETTYGSGAYQSITTNGSTTTITVPSDHHGGAIALFFTVESGDSVTASVTVNGSSASWSDGSTAGALSYSYSSLGAESARVTYCKRISSVPASASVVITYSSITGTARFDRWAIEADPAPIACIVDLRKLPTYATYTHVNDTTVATWNQAYETLAGEWPDGKVYVAHTDGPTNKSYKIIDSADNVHLTHRGHALLAERIASELPEVPRVDSFVLSRALNGYAAYGLTLTAPWTNNGSIYQDAGAYLKGGKVHLTGRIKSTGSAATSDTLISTLPVGMRHTTNLEFQRTDSAGNLVRIGVDGTDNVPFSVGAAGGLRHVSGVGSGATIDLDGISWRVQR